MRLAVPPEDVGNKTEIFLRRRNDFRPGSDLLSKAGGSEQMTAVRSEFAGMDLDRDTELVERIRTVSRFLEAMTAQTCAPYGIGLGEYEILARLLAAGPPYQLTPGQLAAGGVAPATTTSSRLDRLQKAGLIIRRPDPTNGRSLHVVLTPAGQDLTSQITAAQVGRERTILGTLADDERTLLSALLTDLMDQLSAQLGPAPRQPAPRQPATHRPAAPNVALHQPAPQQTRVAFSR
jgi:DNA-binding MarR family transcriptional regulator